jgi:hypothetical protein
VGVTTHENTTTKGRARKSPATTTPTPAPKRTRKAKDSDLVYVEGVGTTLPATPAKRTRKAPAPTAAPTPIQADNDGPTTPTGYVVRWPHAGYDLLKSDGTTEGAAWLVRCNAHGATTEAANAKAGDLLGRKAERAAWCAGCRA